MNHEVQNRIAVKRQPRHIGIPALTTILIAAMPKCPLCWMALMGTLGVGSAINSTWLQPLAVALLFFSIGALFVRARRRGGYGPFLLGLVAAVAIYLFKFTLDYNAGIYLSGATLLGASIWNAFPKRGAADEMQCHCDTSPRLGG